MSNDPKQKLDWDKPIRTRDGLEVKIFTREARNLQPVVGEVLYRDGAWAIHSWCSDGSFQLEAGNTPHHLDLVNYEPERYVWINVYPDCALALDSFDEAECSSLNRIACIKVKVEPGRFDK